MKNLKKLIALTAALALSLTVLAGCGGDGNASGSASVSGSGSASSAAEQAPAPEPEYSNGVGKEYADLVGLYIEESGLVPPAIPGAVAEPASDSILGDHLIQSYPLTPGVELVVYTDAADQHLLQVSVNVSADASGEDIRLGQCVIRFTPYFFDSADFDSVQAQLHLTDSEKGSAYTADTASGRYTFLNSDEGLSFCYLANR